MKHLFRFKLHQLLSVILILIFSCSSPEKKATITAATNRFEKVTNTHTNIHFANTVTEDLYFNFLNYPLLLFGLGNFCIFAMLLRDEYAPTR